MEVPTIKKEFRRVYTKRVKLTSAPQTDEMEEKEKGNVLIAE
jgi:hypothetical protein